MKNGKPVNTISALEKYYSKAVESARRGGREYAINWRICESPSWYIIEIEDDGEQLAFYLTGEWDEVVEFSRTHYNYGYRLIYGKGITEPELAEATTEYIESLGKNVNHA